MMRVRTLERIGSVAAAAARSGLQAEVMLVAIADDAGRELRATRLGGLSRQTLVSVPVDGPSLVADVARSAEPAFLGSRTDVLRNERSAAMAPTSATVAVLPLTGADMPLGVLVLERPSRRGFTWNDCAFMTVLAALCALTVERLRLSAGASAQLRLGGLRIDVESLRIEVQGRSAHLTSSELRLLMFLAENPGRTCTRREILQRLWQTEYVEGERACDAHICNLRRKIERDPASPRLIVTRRGAGYALVLP